MEKSILATFSGSFLKPRWYRCFHDSGILPTIAKHSSYTMPNSSRPMGRVMCIVIVIVVAAVVVAVVCCRRCLDLRKHLGLFQVTMDLSVTVLLHGSGHVHHFYFCYNCYSRSLCAFLACKRSQSAELQLRPAVLGPRLSCDVSVEACR